MEHRRSLEFRQVSGADRLDDHALHAHGFSLPARFIRGGRTPAPLSTKPRRLLFSVRRDVRARYRANGNPWRSLSSDLVSSLCGSIRDPGGYRSRSASTRLRSILRLVPIDHAANLGARGEKISRGRGLRGTAIINPGYSPAQSLIATHSLRARESETAWTTRMYRRLSSKFGCGRTRPFDFTAARKSS